MRTYQIQRYLYLVVFFILLFNSSNLISNAQDENSNPGTMSREQVYADMKATIGIVPSIFKSLPDSTLGLEWELMKRVQMAPGPIPNKYRELIGIAVAAATKCEYCIYFHTEFARMNGATDAEIEDALHYAKSSTGWSTYINGSQTDLDTFKSEVRAIVKYVTEQEAKSAK